VVVVVVVVMVVVVSNTNWNILTSSIQKQRVCQLGYIAYSDIPFFIVAKLLPSITFTQVT
jgi:hypothetical protein